MADFALQESAKLISRKILSDRKIMISSHRAHRVGQEKKPSF